jgi:hypothetical protein
MFEFIKNLFRRKPKKPTTFEEAAQYVADRIEADTVDHPYFHFTGGMAIRNDLNLWDQKSPLYQHMLERFALCHADDTGMLISNAASAIKKGLPYCPREDVERCKRHWRTMGINPATMKRVENEEL